MSKFVWQPDEVQVEYPDGSVVATALPLRKPLRRRPHTNPDRR